VIVIGSGATAVTLVPQLAQRAAHVTMLQRSPTYVMSMPTKDRIANTLRRWLPENMAFRIARWKNIILGILFFRLSKRAPGLVRSLVLRGVRKQLGPDYDIATHFNPRYNPWDQRLCLAPDGDLFKAINNGRASVVTDYIDAFTPSGIQLKSGRQLDADLIVTATGLNLAMLGGIQLDIDGQRVDLSKTINYKGTMFSDVPNLAMALGYTNASWTLKCDLSCEYVCRLLNHMQKHGLQQCTPRNRDPSLTTQPLIDFSSSYIQRTIHRAPKQGSRAPWKLHQNYALDLLSLKYGSIEDAGMEFSNPVPRNKQVKSPIS
jgi:cation diffusion facilitator CzcD-associated flavoprotein CzcO